MMASLSILSLFLLQTLATSAVPPGFNHLAHAVPGGPYLVPDITGRGNAIANLDGRLSHTHFYNPVTGSSARIVSYRWTFPPNTKPFCSTAVCNIRFPLGRTSILLTVRDSTGDTSSTKSSVTVYVTARPRVRVLYILPPKKKAFYSQTIPQIIFRTPLDFPPPLRNSQFSLQIRGFLNIPRDGAYLFRLRCYGGRCYFRFGSRNIFSGQDGILRSRWQRYTKGLTPLVLGYRRQQHSSFQPSLQLEWSSPLRRPFSKIPARYLLHIPNAHEPVLHYITPTQAPVGANITLTGSSFVDVKGVYVGKARCLALIQRNQFIMNCVVPAGLGKTIIRVVTMAGTSNSAPFEIILKKNSNPDSGVGPVGYFQPVNFQNRFLRYPYGAEWKQAQLTAIKIGPDGRFYIGSMGGFVYAIEVDLSNIVRSQCKSLQVGARRSILGLAFNPSDTRPLLKLYATVSTLMWKTKGLFSYEDGWHNGAVILMQQTARSCLEKTKTIISGLPVSNYDHAVNAINFDQYGQLFINVAGTSNAGVSVPDGPLGGIPDSPLSGALLIAPLRRRNFDGRIRYNQYNDPSTTKKISGDVFPYAVGLRNSFSSLFHSNGKIYATDNGANSAFGLRSRGCTRQVPASTEKDSLFLIRRGKFYGHANRNRGRRDPRQCFHKSGSYERPISEFEASTNGILEYTANTFGAQLRGDLLLTKYASTGNGKTFRVRLNNGGLVTSKYQIAAFSGLTAAMSPRGAILMPRVGQGRVAVLSPVEADPGRIVVTSVNPFRGPRRGGNRVTIFGWNLYSPVSITIGGRPCRNVRDYRDGRSVTCVVPRGSGKAPVVATTGGVSSKSYGFEYWYMAI